MFTHSPPTISLHSMAARLSQIRVPPYSSRSTKKDPFNHALNRTSSPTKAKESMFSAPQVQRDRMAHQATKLQQAGPRPQHYQDADRARPGGARSLPKTSRKSHYQNRDKQANMIKPGGRQQVQRKPLQDINPNARDQRTTPRGPRASQSLQASKTVAHSDYPQATLWTMEQQASSRKASAATSQDPSHMSEMYTMIDDFLAWNMSNSDLPMQTRPGSSGTMFVDFNPTGQMEVSYRNGVNKKLPTPPVPSKPSKPSTTSEVPVPSNAISPRKQVHNETREVSRAQRKEAVSKPLASRHSRGSRHDSVVSGAEQSENNDSTYARPLPRLPSGEYKTRPLPRIPSQNPQDPHIQRRETRQKYPPQVHRTQRSSTPISSPTPSHDSNTTFHTAASSQDVTPFEVIDPSGITMHYSAADQQAYVSGQDPETRYKWDYNGQIMHVHGSPTPSRPTSYTSEYFDVPASTYHASAPLLHVTCGSKIPASKSKKYTSKPLPDPPHQDAKKRRSLSVFVKKILNKLDNLGVMKELSHHHRHSVLRAEKLREESWVKHGYVT